MDAEIGRLILATVLSFAAGAALALWLDRVRAGRSRSSRIRALRREVDENIARLGPLDGTARGFPQRIERRAYDAADDVDFSAALSAALAAAYVAGAAVNNNIDLVDRNLTAAGGALDFTTSAGQQADRHQKALSDGAIAAGRVAREAFEKARDELRKL